MVKLVIIALMAALLGHILARFVRGIRATISEGAAGKAVHISTPIGVVDLKPQSELDPALASILVYPGATRTDAQLRGYEVDIQLLGRDYQILTATYSTTTPADIVWEFYKRELPGWEETRQGGEKPALAHDTPDGKQTVRIHTENGLTYIETRLSRKKAATAAAAGASDSRFGMRR